MKNYSKKPKNISVILDQSTADHYKPLFDQIINILHEKQVLQYVVLVGSWSLYLYKFIFIDNGNFLKFRTRDIDFLIPYPPKIKLKVNIPELFKELGFREEFSIQSKGSKLVHPQLSLEFITTEKGKGRDDPYVIKDLNITATGFRYVSMLLENTVKIDYEGKTIKVADPAVFVLHKFLIHERRNDQEKADKDLTTAQNLGMYLIGMDEYRDRIVKIFSTLIPKWKKDILRITEIHSPDIFNVLTASGIRQI